MISPFTPHKILWHPERIAEWFRTGRTRPISWELDLTNLCDHNCPDCPGGRVNKESLNLYAARMYINEIKQFGGKSIVLTGGGEPLLNPITPEIIRYIKYEKELDLSLITNGSTLNEKNIPIILKYCTWIRVSLDAGSPEIFKKTHGCGEKMFNQVLKGISLLSEVKRKNNLQCTVGVAFVTSKKTKNDMLRFTKLCKSLGVDYIQFRPYHYDFADLTKEVARCEKENTQTFSVLKSGNKYEHLGEPRPYGVCYGHHFAGVINIHKLYLCCHFRGMEKYELGDLRKNSLEDIWASERRKQVYENIDYSDCFPVCRCDRFNRILWDLKKNPPAHINFV